MKGPNETVPLYKSPTYSGSHLTQEYGVVSNFHFHFHFHTLSRNYFKKCINNDDEERKI